MTATSSRSGSAGTRAGTTTTKTAPGNVTSLHPSAMRELLPAAGLKEYWYPLAPESKVGSRRPHLVKILGQEIALFRGADGGVAAVAAPCPHRGGNLALGHCHFKGTLTCPYHGWTFDADGECVAVLGEGPQSRIAGAPEARVRSFPTRTLKGIVFGWLGDTEPVPIEEDVPPQFFDSGMLVLNSVTQWRVNWRPAFENLLDAHVFYVHRNSLHVRLMARKNFTVMSKMGPRRPRPHSVNGRGLIYRSGDLAFLSAFTGKEVGGEAGKGSAGSAPADGGKTRRWPNDDRYQEEYPLLSGERWPKDAWALPWHTLVGAVSRLQKRDRPPMITNEEWHDAHLPAIFQVEYPNHIYTRMTVPIDEENSRIFYFHTTQPGSKAKAAWDRAYFVAFQNWMMNYQFSGQDADVIEYQYYDQPEHLSATDIFPLTLRRFILENGRDFLRGTLPVPGTTDAEAAAPPAET